MQVKNYTQDLANYNRFHTRVVELNHFNIGGTNYIRLQSMTNTDTQDIPATIEQASRIIEQGADIVRFTTPTLKDVAALDTIRRNLRVLYDIPIVADIHFSPKVAEAALDVADKIRINPGNFVDKPKGITYDNKLYKAELEKIEKVFVPIIYKAAKNHKAIRIGTNIGSLSERILQRYGASAQGMVQAKLEYIEIARKHNFHNIVISLKASNPKVNIWANRLIVAEFLDRGYDYPIHLGVTEAGNGLDGRIKSAVGIGGLLIDGIGDTIRVSLAEPPENEIPVARKIVNYATARQFSDKLEIIDKPFFNPFDYEPRKLKTSLDFDKPKVIITLFDKLTKFDQIVKPDYLVLNNPEFTETFKDSGIKLISSKLNQQTIPLVNTKDYLNLKLDESFVTLKYKDLKNKTLLRKLAKDDKVAIVFEPDSSNIIGQTRLFIKNLIEKNIFAPIILKLQYQEQDLEDIAIKASIDSGIFFIDGLLNGIWLEAPNIKPNQLTEVALNILQAANSRYFKAEIVACPSCGRATFDVEKITNLVKQRLGHLQGIKIAVMGCIVNGLGEMADADYGYVGTGPDQVSLYKGKKLIMKNLKQEEAVEKLEQLITANQNK